MMTTTKPPAPPPRVNISKTEQIRDVDKTKTTKHQHHLQGWKYPSRKITNRILDEDKDIQDARRQASMNHTGYPFSEKLPLTPIRVWAGTKNFRPVGFL
jgi:hypothetical protein